MIIEYHGSLKIIDHWSRKSLSRKSLSRKYQRHKSHPQTMSIEIWNHDYNPGLISNNPGAGVLNDHWIPMIINENWSQKLQSWKSLKSNFEVEKFLSWENV